jgi:hypothetical protein
MDTGDTKMTRRNYILRWAAVVPGALLSVFVVMFPIHWVVMLQYMNTPDYDASDLEALLSPQTLESFANAFFTPFVLISVGSRIAPKFKFSTGIALAVLLGVFYGWVATVVVGEIQQGLYTPTRWLRLGIAVLLCIAGLGVGLLQAQKVEQRALSAP